MSENESSTEFGYSRPTNDDMRHLFCDVLEDPEEKRLRRLVDSRCENIVHALFEGAHTRVNRNVHTFLSDVLELASVKVFFSRGVGYLLSDKMYELP